MYTALQAVASPLGHPTAEAVRVRARHLFRADDGIRTRDPHLGKVMRYQLRYVRVTPASVPGCVSPATLSDVVHGIQTRHHSRVVDHHVGPDDACAEPSPMAAQPLDGPGPDRLVDDRDRLAKAVMTCPLGSPGTGRAEQAHASNES